MMPMKALILPALLALSACSVFDRPRSAGPQPATAAPDQADPYAGIRPGARPGEASPTADAATQNLQAPKPATGALGTTVASLGNAAEPGLWLKTPLTATAGPGQVSYGGQTVQAQLIPIDGPLTAGSRASLQLMQRLGAPLTGLPEFSVSR